MATKPGMVSAWNPDETMIESVYGSESRTSFPIKFLLISKNIKMHERHLNVRTPGWINSFSEFQIPLKKREIKNSRNS